MEGSTCRVQCLRLTYGATGVTMVTCRDDAYPEWQLRHGGMCVIQINALVLSRPPDQRIVHQTEGPVTSHSDNAGTQNTHTFQFQTIIIIIINSTYLGSPILTNQAS